MKKDIVEALCSGSTLSDRAQVLASLNPASCCHGNIFSSYSWTTPFLCKSVKHKGSHHQGCNRCSFPRTWLPLKTADCIWTCKSLAIPVLASISQGGCQDYGHGANQSQNESEARYKSCVRFVATGYAPRGFLHRRGVEVLEDPQAGIRMSHLSSVTEE